MNQNDNFIDEKHGCSIIICCHNSSRRIKDTLLRIAGQKDLEGIAWEVIIVDNASTDNTAGMAAQVWQDLGAPSQFTIVVEPKPGLSNARRAGILECQYNVAIFCDDDNWLAPNYVSKALTILADHPEAGIIGGAHEPIWEGGSPFPSWFFTYADGFAVGVQAMQSGDITKRGYIWGAGMVLRTSLLRYLYIKKVSNLLQDRKQSYLGSGGDSEICMWYIMTGFRLHYDERLQLSHFVPRSRQSLNYVSKIYKGFAEASQSLNAYNKINSRIACLKSWWSMPLKAIRAELSYRRLPSKTRKDIEQILCIINRYVSDNELC